MTHLFSTIAAHAQHAPDKPCIVPADSRPAVTYDMLVRQAVLFGRLLAANGCHPGAKVAIMTHNTPEFFVALLGALHQGMVAVPVDGGLAVTELQRIFAHAEPGAVVVDQGSARKAAEVGTAGALIAVDAGAAGGISAFDTAAAVETTAASPQPCGSGQLALLLYTSGTTGAPKGVMHSHATILARVKSITEWFSLSSADRAFCMLPTHFGHGLICNCLSALFHGSTLVLSRPFDLDVVKTLWQSIDRNEITWFSSVPTIVRMLLQLADLRRPRRPPRLRFVTCASAPLRVEEIEQFERTFGVPLLNCYGITETASWTAFSPNSPERDKLSVGTQFGCEIRAVDAGGRALPPGQQGELQIRGPSVMLGYYNDRELTSKVLRDGWFCTGDYGDVDAGGRVHLLSRIKEVIIRAGLNVYPTDVDTVLLAHPAVSEAYTVGLPNEMLGESVAAVVVRKARAQVTEREVLLYCRGALAAYKCPERICFVDSVQKNSRGKVNRANLRSLFAN